MSGSQISSAGLDPRRRRVLFRCWHRGMREMDLIMGGFADGEIANLTDAEMDDLEVLMDAPDPDIFKWLTGAADLPAEFDTPVFRRMKQFHTHFAPKFA